VKEIGMPLRDHFRPPVSKKVSWEGFHRWSHTLIVGQPLPTVPLWLREDLVIALDLEQSYEQACSDLWIS
jgi:hypothetical protein